MSRLRKVMMVGVALFAISFANSYAWQQGWVAQQVAQGVALFHQQMAAAGLAVDEVLVTGRARTEARDVLAALDLSRGTPILAFDPAEARERLEGLPWIGAAAVERHLPDTVYVRLAEREPMALWQRQGKLSVIDTTGKVIPGAEPTHFAELPQVVGEDAPAHTAALLAMLDTQPQLKQRVNAAVRVSGRRWNLRMDHGIDVQLPEENAERAWTRLAEIEASQGVLTRDIIVIDMRLPNQLVIRMAPGAQPADSPAAGKVEGETT